MESKIVYPDKFNDSKLSEKNPGEEFDNYRLSVAGRYLDA